MGFESDVSGREVDEDTWELVEPLIYVGNKDTFVVPEDFQSDFASVPRAFVWLLPRYGRYTKASILHDALPFLTITVWLFLFWVAELITFLIVKPFSKKPVNAPMLTWRMS
jgi:hypothetical protein